MTWSYRSIVSRSSRDNGHTASLFPHTQVQKVRDRMAGLCEGPPERLVNAVKCINVHPGYNPVNRGWYPQVHAIIKDLPIGATIHEIDEKLDHGPIISRAYVEKRITDTSLSLYNRILEKELELLDGNILDILDGSYSVSSPEDEGVLHLRKDFDNLREFDLESRMTGMEFINRLRGMTHGDFRNLYFRDPETGRKIFVSISLTEEAD